MKYLPKYFAKPPAKSKHTAQSKYTVILIPPGNTSTRQFRIPIFYSKIALGFVGGIILALLSLTFYLSNFVKAHQTEYAKVEEIQSQLDSKDKEIASLNNQNSNITVSKSDIKTFETQVSAILKVQVPENNSVSRGLNTTQNPNSTVTESISGLKKDIEVLQQLYQDTLKYEDWLNHLPSPIDSYKNVPVYNNGPDYIASHGASFSYDGYYFGLKWQCVEFVKRFYYMVKDLKMPNDFGNARDFFDPSVPQGSLNKERGLIQYRNGGDVKPEPDDILVFTNAAYGHVAIVTKVTEDSLEVIQQNEKVTRQVFKLEIKNNHFFVGTSVQPVGWLRKPQS